MVREDNWAFEIGNLYNRKSKSNADFARAISRDRFFRIFYEC